MRFISYFNVYLSISYIFLLSSCSTVTSSPPPPEITFNIFADTQANSGGLFYFVIHRTNEKQFMSDVYQDIANNIFNESHNLENLGFFSVVPGMNQEFKIIQPSQGSISLYFLLTQPNPEWKKLISMPFQENYDINIKSDNQIYISEHKPWYLWFY